MDPLGFGFENFDAIGAWRNRDGKHAIDPSGVLPDGRLQGAGRAADDPQSAAGQHFAHCLTEKMLTYAPGPRRRSARSLRRGRHRARMRGKDQYRFSSLVLEIVKSEPFQNAERQSEARNE